MRRLLGSDRVTSGAAAMLLLMLIAAIVVPMLARQDPLAIGDVLALRLVPPFSTDTAGRVGTCSAPIASAAISSYG
ncbi:MAG: hypothetical protein ACHQQR_15420 [Gemmatimonadales bacterium]